MALQKQFEGTGITRNGDPYIKVITPSLKLVDSGRKCTLRPAITPPQSCSANFYRHIKRRVGRSFGGIQLKGNLLPSRKQIAYKLPRTKGGLLGPKGVPRPLLKQDSSCSNQHHSGGLHKEGDMRSGSLCALLWRILTWCSRKQVTLKAQHIKWAS